jgi:hypothetical protein
MSRRKPESTAEPEPPLSLGEKEKENEGRGGLDAAMEKEQGEE